MQSALLMEMGLSYGDQDSKVEEMLLSMENRDALMAGERGIKKTQS